MQFRRFDWLAFLRDSETNQTNRLDLKPNGHAANVPFQNPATPQPLRPLRFQKRTFTASTSSNLIRSAERDFDGFLKLESLDFFETPSPTKIGSENPSQKPGN